MSFSDAVAYYYFHEHEEILCLRLSMSLSPFEDCNLGLIILELSLPPALIPAKFELNNLNVADSHCTIKHA